jgi:general secretion pathway protein L
MQEKLIIYIHAHTSVDPSWAIVGVDGKVRQSAYRDSADGLGQLALDKDVIVLVPAEDVLLTSCRLPKMQRSRLQQALPFALEEQLIGEIDSLHFAIGDYQPDTPFGVAIVAHEKMQQWLALLQTWEVKANAMLPITMAIPYAEDVWHAIVQDMVVLRTDSLQGFCCDNNNFLVFLNLALAQAANSPRHILIKNYSSQPVLENTEMKVTIQEDLLPAETFIVDAAQTALTTPYINLLQGNYTAKKAKLPQLDNAGKIVLRLAKVVLLLLFLYPFASLLILSNRVNSIDEKIKTIYQSNFPQAHNVVAPKVRMQEKLNKLSAQLAENRFLLLLGVIGKGMSETPSIKLKRLDFQNNQVTLMLMAASSEDFSTFTDFLTSKGLKVKQQNATLSGERVTAALQVE